MDRASVYLVTNRGVRPLVREGDAVENAAPIAILQGHQGNSAGDLSLVATLEDGRIALLAVLEARLPSRARR
jgi:hypothetical protein